jgi:putative ABC transport system substrate-binding protein
MAIQRREFITLIGAGVAWPLRARAQPVMPVIGYLTAGTPKGFATGLAAFRVGLEEVGYRENKNVAIEYRWGDGQDDRLLEMANELVQRRVNVLVTPGGVNAARAAKKATNTIPIVFETGLDPVDSGLVTNLSRPTENITGVTSLNIEVGPKRFELLRQLRPTATAAALLINPRNPNFKGVVEESRKATETLGLELHILEASTEGDFDVAFGIFDSLRAGGLVVTPDPFFIGRSARLATLTLRHGILAIFHTREFVDAGGLVSYGGSTSESHRQAGIYTGRILMGKTASELPVQQITKVQLFINLNAAKALGITVPPSLLVTANEVIE